jgi:hypothetical protein
MATNASGDRVEKEVTAEARPPKIKALDLIDSIHPNKNADNPDDSRIED